jgi:hypothetical protein
MTTVISTAMMIRNAARCFNSNFSEGFITRLLLVDTGCTAGKAGVKRLSKVQKKSKDHTILTFS